MPMNPNFRGSRPIVDPMERMPDRPVSPMPRITGGGKTPYPPNVDYRPVNKMYGRGNPPMVQPPADIGMKPPFYTDAPPGGRNVPAMPARPGGLPMSNAPGGGIAATSPPGGGGALMPGAPNVPSASLPVGATYKKGGKVKKMASGGMTSKVSSASKRADGIAQRGKTKCKIC